MFKTFISIIMLLIGLTAIAKHATHPTLKQKISYGVEQTNDLKKIAEGIGGSSFIREAMPLSKTKPEFKVIVWQYDFEPKQTLTEDLKRVVIYSFTEVFAVSNYKEAWFEFDVSRFKDFKDDNPRKDKPFRLHIKKDDVDSVVKNSLASEGIFSTKDLRVVIHYESGSTLDLLAPEYDNLIYESKKPGLSTTFNQLMQYAKSY